MVNSIKIIVVIAAHLIALVLLAEALDVPRVVAHPPYQLAHVLVVEQATPVLQMETFVVLAYIQTKELAVVPHQLDQVSLAVA